MNEMLDTYDRTMLNNLTTDSLATLVREAEDEVVAGWEDSAWNHYEEVVAALAREAKRINDIAAWPGNLNHRSRRTLLRRATHLLDLADTMDDARDLHEVLILRATAHGLRGSSSND